MCSFRTCNHHLPIESGCWVNIPRNERICNLCNKQEVWDVFNKPLMYFFARIKSAIFIVKEYQNLKKNGLSLNRHCLKKEVIKRNYVFSLGK